MKDQNNTIKSTVKICYDIDKENFNELCIKLKDQFKYEIAYALTKLDINNPSVKILMGNPKFYAQYQKYRTTELIPMIKNWIEEKYNIESIYEYLTEEQEYIITTELKLE